MGNDNGGLSHTRVIVYRGPYRNKCAIDFHRHCTNCDEKCCLNIWLELRFKGMASC